MEGPNRPPERLSAALSFPARSAAPKAPLRPLHPHPPAAPLLLCRRVPLSEALALAVSRPPAPLSAVAPLAALQPRRSKLPSLAAPLTCADPLSRRPARQQVIPFAAQTLPTGAALTAPRRLRPPAAPLLLCRRVPLSAALALVVSRPPAPLSAGAPQPAAPMPQHRGAAPHRPHHRRLHHRRAQATMRLAVPCAERPQPTAAAGRPMRCRQTPPQAIRLIGPHRPRHGRRVLSSDEVALAGRPRPRQWVAVRSKLMRL